MLSSQEIADRTVPFLCPYRPKHMLQVKVLGLYFAFVIQIAVRITNLFCESSKACLALFF